LRLWRRIRMRKTRMQQKLAHRTIY